METRNRIRNTFAAVIAAAAVSAFAGTPAASSRPVPKTVVLLVDVSKSIPTEDRKKTYRESFANALASMRPSDRLVIGPVGAKDRSNWLSEFDMASPASTGTRIADERAAAAFARKATSAFDSLMERGEKTPEGATRIADAVEAASEAFARDPGNVRVLVILSDMEESGAKPAKAKKAPAILEGASVIVAGAGGGQRYAEYESGWRGYFSGTRGAELTYGRFPARIAK